MSLEDRLHAVESVLAIQSLKARYAALVDARYAGGSPADVDSLATLSQRIGELFTEEATWDGGPGLGQVHGREAIAQRMRQPTLRFARHLFTAPDITVDGDRATGTWQLLSPMTTADGTHHWMHGVEEDTYALVDGCWLHASMRLTTVFVAPISEGWNSILA